MKQIFFFPLSLGLHKSYSTFEGEKYPKAQIRLTDLIPMYSRIGFAAKITNIDCMRPSMAPIAIADEADDICLFLFSPSLVSTQLMVNGDFLVNSDSKFSRILSWFKVKNNLQRKMSSDLYSKHLLTTCLWNSRG